MTNHNQQSNPMSVLASLRRLLPDRALTMHEALRLAELQADRLRTLLDVGDAPFPGEAIGGLPRITVEYEADMQYSGVSDWDEHRSTWVIILNALEPETRQRFSLLHEYKHIIDHGSAGLVGEPVQGFHGDTPAIKQVADYFAACVLMPKRLVKREWGQLNQDIATLADTFEVSGPAMTIRLMQLGLLEGAPWPSASSHRGGPVSRRFRYRRELSGQIGAAAGVDR